jgi:hypothetical protein
MSVSPTPGPISVRQEGRNARATTRHLNFLFPDSDAHNIAEAHSRLILEADSRFRPRWKAYSGANLSQVAFHEIVQEITLHWILFHASNHLPLRIDEADWEHPQTRRIVQAGVKRNLPPGSDVETKLCAHLLGLSEAEYLLWRDADDAFLGIM